MAGSDGPRIAIIGNAGGGKSTLARQIAATRGIPHVEIDRLLWHANWQPADAESYDDAHDQALSESAWVIDGLGRRESIPSRLRRSTEIILIDLPLWVHFWLAAERQTAWKLGSIEHPPADASKAPSTEALFRTIWEVDRMWMPALRDLIQSAEGEDGRSVIRINSLEQLDQLTSDIQSCA